MLGRDVVTSNSLYFGVGHLRPELDGGFKMPAPDQQTLNYRRRRPVAIVAGLAVSMLASIPVFAGAVSGTGPVTQPNPNTNSVQAYATLTIPERKQLLSQLEACPAERSIAARTKAIGCNGQSNTPQVP
jgi:hypothetical protein